MTSDSQQLTQEALDAFWECITRRFPEAKTGDLSPLISFHLTQAAESAVREWVFANVPKRRRRKTAPVAQVESTHTPGPWFVGGTDMDCCRFGITAREPTEYIASVGLLDYPKRADHANARLIAAAPDLRSMVLTAMNAFGERLSCLRDERREALRCSDEVEDIDDHILHYEALVRKCDAVLQKTTAGRVPVSR